MFVLPCLLLPDQIIFFQPACNIHYNYRATQSRTSENPQSRIQTPKFTRIVLTIRWTRSGLDHDSCSVLSKGFLDSHSDLLFNLMFSQKSPHGEKVSVIYEYRSGTGLLTSPMLPPVTNTSFFNLACLVLDSLQPPKDTCARTRFVNFNYRTRIRRTYTSIYRLLRNRGRVK